MIHKLTFWQLQKGKSLKQYMERKKREKRKEGRGKESRKEDKEGGRQGWEKRENEEKKFKYNQTKDVKEGS
jgi:hypothetical protein